MTTQQQIDFDRGDQLGLLDAAEIPSISVRDGRTKVRVSGATSRSVLRAIDSFGRGGTAWPSIETLGRTVGRNERTVRRAVTALVEMQLVIVEPAIGRANRYRINWGELSLRARRPAPGHLDANPGHSDRNPGHSDANPGHSVQRSVQEASEAYSRSMVSSDMVDYMDLKDSRSVVRIDEIADEAALLFERLRVQGPKGGQTLWKAAGALHVGLLSRHAVADACAAVQAMRAKGSRIGSPVGYFRRVLASSSSLSDEELSALLRRVHVQPRLPEGPPERRTSPVRVARPHRPPPGVTAGDIELRRQAIIKTLDSLESE